MRVRLVSVTVQLQLVADDGTHLTPVQAPPVTVVAADWDTWDLAAHIAELERQITR